MRLATLKHITETAAEPQTTRTRPQPASDPYAATMTWSGGQDRQISGQEMIDANNMVQSLRADHLQQLSLDQKIELLLKKVTTAEQAAFQALREVGAFNNKLDQALSHFTKSSAHQQGEAADSIWSTDDDPESIFGR